MQHWTLRSVMDKIEWTLRKNNFNMKIIEDIFVKTVRNINLMEIQNNGSKNKNKVFLYLQIGSKDCVHVLLKFDSDLNSERVIFEASYYQLFKEQKQFNEFLSSKLFAVHNWWQFRLFLGYASTTSWFLSRKCNSRASRSCKSRVQIQ